MEWPSSSTGGLGMIIATGSSSTLRKKVASWSFRLIVVLITLDERIVQVEVGLTVHIEELNRNRDVRGSYRESKL